jgi:hypothetical protein
MSASKRLWPMVVGLLLRATGVTIDDIRQGFLPRGTSNNVSVNVSSGTIIAVGVFPRDASVT